jgi:hypothetical protein
MLQSLFCYHSYGNQCASFCFHFSHVTICGMNHVIPCSYCQTLS